MLRDWLRQLKYSTIKWRHSPSPNSTHNVTYLIKLKAFVNVELIEQHYSPLVAKAEYIEVIDINAIRLLSTMMQLNKLLISNKDIPETLTQGESQYMPLYDWLTNDSGNEIYPHKYITAILDSTIEFLTNLKESNISDASKDYFRRKSHRAVNQAVDIVDALIRLTH